MLGEDWRYAIFPTADLRSQKGRETHDQSSCTQQSVKTPSTLFLLKPGDTRFYTQYNAVRRLLRCKGGVQKSIVSTEFSEWRQKSKESKEKARILTRVVLNAAFWTALARFCMLLKPLVHLIKLVDSNMPSISKVSCCPAALHRNCKEVCDATFDKMSLQLL